MILEGVSDSEVARKCSINRGTLSEWRHHHVGFQAELARCSRELLDGAMERLQGLVPLAVDSLREELQSDGPGRLQAALFLVKRWDSIQASLPVPKDPDEVKHEKLIQGLCEFLDGIADEAFCQKLSDRYDAWVEADIIDASEPRPKALMPPFRTEAPSSSCQASPIVIAEDGPSDEEIASPCQVLPRDSEASPCPVAEAPAVVRLEALPCDEEPELSEVEEVEEPEARAVTSCAECPERCSCRRASPEGCPKIHENVMTAES
jgi:hypothetical protein